MSGSMLLTGGLLAIGAGIGVLVLAFAPGRAPRSGVSVALAAIEGRYGRRAAQPGSGDWDASGALPGWLRSLALLLSPAAITRSLQRRLDLAGNPARWSPDRILAVKGLGLLVGAFLGALYGLLHTPVLLVLYAAIAGAIGFFLPDVLLYNAGQKRQAQVTKELADALDMLTVCVEAGLGFDAALAQVARNTSGALATELTRVLQEMQIGKTRAEALRAMLDRTTVDDLRAFVSAIIQAGELGIAVAQVLREQAGEMRLRRRQRAEERAQQVSVKITFPLILCLFPAIFVVVIGPGAIMIMRSLLGSHGLGG